WSVHRRPYLFPCLLDAHNRKCDGRWHHLCFINCAGAPKCLTRKSNGVWQKRLVCRDSPHHDGGRWYFASGTSSDKAKSYSTCYSVKCSNCLIFMLSNKTCWF